VRSGSRKGGLNGLLGRHVSGIIFP
jgi:hypothetical protein